MQLKGRGIVVTGANQGLGKAIAAECIQQGAHVVICARNQDLLRTTERELKSIANAGQIVAAIRADVAVASDVSALAEFATQALPALTGLVNNAGVHGPKGLIEDVDWEEWVSAIHTNLMGTVLLSSKLVPHFRRAKYGKIVNLSGGGATAPFPRISAYAASKAAIVRFTETLAEEARDAKIDVNALAPGALNTRLLQDVLDAGPQRVGPDVYARAVRQKEQGGASIHQAAQAAAFLLSAASDGITGRLISAVWDPWRELPSLWPSIANTDVYTLRRIIPKDRGFDWE